MRTRWSAAGMGAGCTAMSVAALAIALAVGWSGQRVVEGFVASNVLIGLGFGACGALIAWHRPRLGLGWLLGIGGLCQTLSALAAPLATLLLRHDAPRWLIRLDLTAFQWAWPLNIAVAIPLALLLLPDGKIASKAWRRVFVAVAASAPLFVLETGLEPNGGGPFPKAYLTLPSYDGLDWLWTVSEVRLLASLLAGVICLGWRYARGTEEVRRQLLWVITAAAVVLMAITPWALVAGTPIAVLFALPLIPASIAVAVLRHRLLDIRLVVARGLSYALLSGLVLAAYAGLVAILSTGVVSALIVALCAVPLRSRLQVAVDRLMYGERSDPLRIASRVGQQLPHGLADALEEIRRALLLPGVRIERNDTEVAAAGDTGSRVAILPLTDSNLVVGLRSGESVLGDKDARALQLLAGPLSVAVAATTASEELQASRERLVLAREEERRRLRRDLHDGLGPLLTGIALSADAADNMAERSPEEMGTLLRSMRAETRSAITEVRRIVENLRPPVLEELGLLSALRIRAAQTERRADGAPLIAVIDAPDELPTLPAAVELAVYRIATEGLTNAVRHSTASSVVVRLACDDELHLEVRDDGSQDRQGWRPGVGITGMRERVAELGGRCHVGPSATGGRIDVSLPLVTA